MVGFFVIPAGSNREYLWTFSRSARGTPAWSARENVLAKASSIPSTVDRARAPPPRSLGPRKCPRMVIQASRSNSITGVCGGTDGSEPLELAVTTTGSQLLEVTAKDFHGEYPWEGEHTHNVVFPLEEGASADGEGWMLVLHLNQ